MKKAKTLPIFSLRYPRSALEPIPKHCGYVRKNRSSWYAREPKSSHCSSGHDHRYKYSGPEPIPISYRPKRSSLPEEVQSVKVSSPLKHTQRSASSKGILTYSPTAAYAFGFLI